ncbi:DNA-dependent RNA polymerase auxiliary subunit epsilon family protein [Bacillus shivajii]|uniref:DNA-dependent RNA polymerase subunit epsilon n=1 Tax=Bacillus shivajii TaxID=1983719 RepID=UPI001CFA20B7|nr:DNA-directed RNA polymerase subunit epsilon [Bacillus shivajii]UCZ51891.1 DNA-dependent RNA polymerase auxiliary subunit epsilon family protein [Bacillus shivajii]
MIFKVYYQKTINEVPVREATNSMYIEAESVEETRKKLADREYNIEFITPVTGDYLEYERQHEDFHVETV